MISPLHPEIFLQPGKHYFAGRDSRIRTVPGSCLSMPFWHPQLRAERICRYMLPERGSARRTGDRSVPDRPYADKAIALLPKKIDVVGAPYTEYQVKVFGGGNMFPETDKNRMSQIGILNVQVARRLAKQHGFTCVAEHLDDIGYRNVVFDLWSGEVWVKHTHVLSITGHELINRRLG